jgi:hypothetical protein
MSSHDPDDGAPPAGAQPTPVVNRRGFLGAAAVAAVGAPALLGAWQSAPVTEAKAQQGVGCRPQMQAEPWMLVHERIAAVIGAGTNVRVLPLERAAGGYLQRIQTDDDRTGTALATVLAPQHEFASGRGASPLAARAARVATTRLTVQVENANRTPWPAREVKEQGDLVHAMKDALATNTLAEGVLRASLQPGTPVVALFKPVVVRLPVGAASDFYRHHLEPASGGASAVFNRTVGGIQLASTVRDATSS